MRYDDVDWGLANCAGADLRSFFPNNGIVKGNVRRVCEWCEIRPECNAYANENDERGYWGGEYFPERDRTNGDPGPIQPRGDGDPVPHVPHGAVETVHADERQTDGSTTDPAAQGPCQGISY